MQEQVVAAFLYQCLYSCWEGLLHVGWADLSARPSDGTSVDSVQ